MHQTLTQTLNQKVIEELAEESAFEISNCSSLNLREESKTSQSFSDNEE
jgi:hypothetical protein